MPDPERDLPAPGPSDLGGVSLELLSAYVDGDVSSAERAEVEAALARSPELRVELEEMRVLARMSEAFVPTGPARDLWPEIRDRALAPPWWRRLLGFQLVPGVVAAGVVAAVLVAVPFGGPGPEVLEPPGLAAARAAYRQAIEALEADTLARVRKLSPETRDALEETLAEVDAAIREAETALREAPHDAFAHRMLLALYDEKLRVMQAVMQREAGAG